MNGTVLNTIRTELDLPGFALFAPAAVMFLLALQFGGGNDYTWDSATVIGLFCGAAGCLVVFLFWEHRRGDRAMIPFSIMRKKAVWTSCLVGMGIISMAVVASFYLPIYFQAVKGVSPWTSGTYVLPSILSSLLFTVMSGVLSRSLHL